MAPMATKVMLRLRDLETGQAKLKELESVEHAIAFLRERPRMTEVLGVVFEGISREENDRMRASMRALDDDERARVTELDAAERKVREAQAEARRREAAADAERQREAAKNAPVDRPMEIRFRFDEPELSKVDAHDDRPITEEARAAVMAWVEERMEWVASRGQTVGEAKVTVYPGPVPAKAERVVLGTFVPVTAPPKGTN